MQALYFTQPYAAGSAVCFVHRNNHSYTQPGDLSGKRIGVCAGCAYESYLKGSLVIPDQTIDFVVKDVTIVGYDTDTSALEDLADGDGARLDAVLTDPDTGQTAKRNGLPLKQLGGPVYYDYVAAAIDRQTGKESTSFVEKVTEAIQSMHGDGTLVRLSQQYYGQDTTTAAGRFDGCRAAASSASRDARSRPATPARCASRSTCRTRRRSRRSAHRSASRSSSARAHRYRARRTDGAAMPTAMATEVRSFGYPSSITEERFELDGVRVSSTVTANVFDSYGALVQRRVTTTEHAKGLNPYAQHIETVALAGVVNDTSSWCLGRPATTLTTRQHSLPGGSAVTRTVAHGWDFVRCRSTQQVVERSNTSLRVATDLAYDSYGNVSSETVTPVGLPARTTSLAWGENGSFLTTRTNAEGHVERLAWDSATGLPVTSTDPNGLVTSLQHDDLGRVVRQTRPDRTSTVISRTSCGTNCVWPGAAYLVSVMQRGAGEVPIVSAETGYDRAGREV